VGSTVVIGGTGFIGRQLVAALSKRGHTITVISRVPYSSAPSGVRHVQSEIADSRCIRSVLDRNSVVYHLGMGGGKNWGEYRRDWVDSTRNLVEACAECGARRLIYVSSSAALYLGEKRRITEADGCDPKPNTRGYYSRAKIMSERLLMDFHARNRFPITIIRPFIVVGHGGELNHSGVGMWPTDTCCIGWDNGRHALPFVLVNDVTAALVSAAEVDGIGGMAFNLAGDVCPSAAQFVAWFAERSVRNIRFVPSSASRIFGAELARWLVAVIARKSGRRMPTYRDVKSRAMPSQIDCSAARLMLNWRPNADVELFIHEVIESQLAVIHPNDLRLNTALFAPMRGSDRLERAVKVGQDRMVQ